MTVILTEFKTTCDRSDLYFVNPLLHELFRLLGYLISVVLDRERHAVSV